MSQATAITDEVEPNLLWRTRRFVDLATGGSTEAVDIVQQLTTDLGQFIVMAVRTPRERYWVVSDPNGFGLYQRSEYDGADGVLSAHLDAVHAG